MTPVSAPATLLLIADSAVTCERIASALLSAPVLYRIERVTSDEMARQAIPPGVRLALVDQDLKAIKPAQLIQRLATLKVPGVALVDPRDVDGLQEIVLSGVAGIVISPFEDAQLWDTVGTALARGPVPLPVAPVIPVGENGRRGATQGITIVVHAPKSGTGASVIAANLAVTLQKRAPRGAVLVEAGEGIASQAVLLNLNGERTFGDLVARFDPHDVELLNEILAKHASGLRVLLTFPSPGQRIQPQMLGEIVDLLQMMYDYVIIDLPASTTAAMTTAMLQKANAALVVIVPEMTSLHRIKEFADTVASTVPDADLNIVLNRSNLPAGVPVDAIRRHLKLQIVAELPDDQPLVTDSINRGQPFVTSHPRSALARAVQSLANDLTLPLSDDGRSGQPAGQQRRIAPLSRLISLGRHA